MSPHHPSLLLSRSLVRPREPAFWIFVAVLAVTAVIQFGEQGFLRQLSPSGWLLAWGLVALYVAPASILVYTLDLYEREPIRIVLASALWGAVAATTLSAIGNEGWGLVVARIGGPDFAARWSAALTAPVIEEVAKGAGIVLLVLIVRDEVEDLMDGFVYGAVCGLGFAAVEDVFYLVGVFGGTTSGVVQGFFVRIVAGGLYGHVLYSGLVGMAVGVVVSRRTGDVIRSRRALAALLCAAAVGGHFLWNSPLLTFFPPEPWTGTDWLVIPLATAVKGLPLLTFVGLAIRLARRRERKWLDRALRLELDHEGLTPAELEVLREPARRRAARRAIRRRAGARASRLLHRLQREQMNLAMVRSYVADDADPALVAQRALCRSLRDALDAIPRAARGATAAEPVPGDR
jgi:RsiW-degrading membrane proteinase PrsW (M82 family)